MRTCIDPFAGCGTPPLACQFLGIDPIAVEVNPYLADVIESKLSTYDCNALLLDLAEVSRRSESVTHDVDLHFLNAPRTFVEPDVNGPQTN